MSERELQIDNSASNILKSTELEARPKTSQKQKKEKAVGVFGMFRFADQKDILLIIFGVILALANGAALPLSSFLLGNMIDSFGDTNSTEDNNETRDMLFLFIYIGLGVFVSGWIMTAIWVITGERQSIKCRKQYLFSLLRQEIGWFDMINQAELSSQFSSDTLAFQGAMSDKIPIVLYVIALAISGFVIAFSTGWLLTLVMFGSLPVIIGSMSLLMYHVQNKGNRQSRSYSVAGGRAEQALAAIKTVKMMNGQTYESTKYDECLKGATDGAIKYGIFTGISLGATTFAMMSTYALGFWFGSHCINTTQRCQPWLARQQYSSGTVFTVVFTLINVGFNISQLPLALKKITQGRVAAGRIFKIIDRQPKIKNPQNGVKIDNFQGLIKFHNVHFSYPKDPSKKILNGINLQINKNKVAFVGQSGCGKSTLMQLIMRFYDPDEGYITIDGHDLRTVDLTWLRSVIGYVGQEPVLFATSIRENLLFAKKQATDKELEDALKKAQAFDFVNQLQDKLETQVGLGGGQISGGQKQRLAIARAILKDPKILLLDEATSALDRKNEKSIQKTLNQISLSRISITIAHRVKTVISSDEIFVIDSGVVLENGRFSDLKRFAGIVNDQEQQNVVAQVQEVEIQSMPKQELTQEKKQGQEELIKKEREELIEVYNKNTYGRVFSYVKGKIPHFVIGIICSGTLGCIYPVFTIFLSNLLQNMLDKENLIDQASTKALIFFLLGILAIILSIIQNVCFEIVGGKITSQIRSQVFNKMMKLPIYWYERPKNNVGSLTTRLSVDCKQVKQMTTTYVYTLIQIFVGLICGLVIAFVYEWRTSLVSLALIPLLILSGALRAAFRRGSVEKTKETYAESSNLIMQSMTNIRTVSSFGYENIVYEKYSKKLQIPESFTTKNGIISGFFYGLSQFLTFLVIGLIMFISSLFVKNNGASVEGMLTAIFSIIFSSMSVGNNSQLLPDMGECKISAANLFLILEEKDEDMIQIDEKSKMLKKQINGNFEFKDISFRYENRSEYLFKNFHLDIPFGEKVAFVGTSGCGKSTLMSFLLRFYEPESGTILLDGVNIKDFDIHFLRSQFGYVSQEPTLFNDSFRGNIIYNMQASEDEMILASKKAYSYEFITSHDSVKDPLHKSNDKGNSKQEQKQTRNRDPFDRSVGIKGSHISGGQKQRIAIARAILRKPNILLLDEATSALDSVNEKKVQQCLDEIMIGKSSISIAHRLDTIKNSKLIYVFDKGRIAEYGNYEDLMRKKGYFYNLEQGVEFK